MTNKAEGRANYIKEVYTKKRELKNQVNELLKEIEELERFLYWYADEEDIYKIELKLNLTNKNY